MVYDISYLNEFYTKNFQDFKKAYECVKTNKSSLLCDYIDKIIDNIKKIDTFSWNDSISSSIKNSLNSCNASFLSLKSDIETNFYGLEKLYEDGYNYLVNLESQILEYQDKLNAKPQRTSYQQRVTLPDGTFSIETSNEYDKALTRWNTECETYKGNCFKTVDLVNEVIANLQSIDGTTTIEATVPYENNTLVVNKSGKIINSENYHFDMCDPRWASIYMNDGGGTVGKGGCFMTASATAISMCLGSVVTPADTTNIAKKYNLGGVKKRNRTVCGLATCYGLNYNVIEKKSSNFANEIDASLNRVQNKESTIVWQITPGTTGTYKTGNGHYLNIVNARKDESGAWEVEVWESGYAPQRSTREGWHKFEEINKVANNSWSYYEFSSGEIPNADTKRDEIKYLNDIQSMKGVAL